MFVLCVLAYWVIYIWVPRCPQCPTTTCQKLPAGCTCIVCAARLAHDQLRAYSANSSPYCGHICEPCMAPAADAHTMARLHHLHCSRSASSDCDGTKEEGVPRCQRPLRPLISMHCDVASCIAKLLAIWINFKKIIVQRTQCTM